jgi:hypothetical protein
MLTVEETLEYTSRMQLPNSVMQEEDRQQYVDSIASTLGLGQVCVGWGTIPISHD